MLRGLRGAGGANWSVYAELSKSEKSYNKRMREFNRFAPMYDGNPKKVFEWCEKLEKHLDNYEGEQIPNV